MVAVPLRSPGMARRYGAVRPGVTAWRVSVRRRGASFFQYRTRVRRVPVMAASSSRTALAWASLAVMSITT
ncbi:hypothetical protein GCM10027214_08500 [Stenotrophomonas tumulicola]